MGVAIELEAVTRRFSFGSVDPIVAINGVDLRVEPGEAVSLMGPSGSGKSTLLHLIGAMDRPDEGQIVVGGRDVTALSRREQAAYRRAVGFVFQRFHLLAALDALDNVLAPVIPYRTPYDKEVRAAALLRSVGLAGKERRLPSRLSGGEQQRVAIARALINDPQLLLADEPTGNLDSTASVEIVELLLRLREEFGMTLIVATHDPLVATRCDRIVELQDGGIAADLPVAHDDGGDQELDVMGLGPGT